MISLFLTNTYFYIKENIEKNFSIYKDYFLNFFKNYKDSIFDVLFFSVILFLVYYILKTLLLKIINIGLKVKYPEDQEARKERLSTLFSVFRSLLKILFFSIFIILVLKEFNIKIIQLLTAAGVLGAMIIFSFQDIIKDIIKGWLLIFEDQFRKGEIVNINNTYIGKVKDVNLRFTLLVDKDRNYIYISNSQINFLTNITRSRKKFFINIKLSKDVKIEEFIDRFKKYLIELKNKYPKISELKLEEDIKIFSDYFEIVCSFESKFMTGINQAFNLKMDIYKEFENEIKEII
jgi:small-conductance mechanosensitive channel